MKELTKEQWIEILLNKNLTKDLDISMFQELYSFKGHQASAGQLGLLLGFKGKNPASPLNSEVGRYAKRIANFYDIDFTERTNQKYKFGDLFLNGWVESNRFFWQLKNELNEALKETGLTGEFQYPEEIYTDGEAIFSEGLKKTIIVNSFERNLKARQKCIEHWKPICAVCGFDFGKKYGDLGKGFIHIHHLITISEIGSTYQIDPINDLRPVCPNCHSMLHKTNPPLKIDELRNIINNQYD